MNTITTEGTDGNDTFVQPAGDIDNYRTYYGRHGNDIFKLYMGMVDGGHGDDYVEYLPGDQAWRQIMVSYGTSPVGVVVNLEEGWAEDGWGTRDTLVGVTQVSGTWHGDRITGSSADNTISTGAGINVIDGRAGNDLVYLPQLKPNMTLDELSIAVSIDGLSAVVTYAGAPSYRTTLYNVERISANWPDSTALADFIKPADKAIIGLLAADSNRWNAADQLGTAKALTFSFNHEGDAAQAFAPLSPAARDAVRAILAQAAAVTGLSFTEVEHAATPGALRFGATQQSDTKGTSVLPGMTGAGQVWFDIESLLDISYGSAGYALMLHEIGHALGLRHPRNTDAGDHFSEQMRILDDRAGNTVMSQTVSPDGLFAASWSMLDITALRHLYGSAQANAGDSVYVLASDRFTAVTSIVDDGGTDTIDASRAGAGVSINLVPGHLSSAGITQAGLGAIDNLGIEAYSWIENATGTAYDDVLLGNALDNLLRGGLGNDWLDGAAGADTALFEGKRSDYFISTSFGKTYVAARDGSGGYDTLLGIETFAFSDQAIAVNTVALASDLLLEVDQNGSLGGQLPKPEGVWSYALVGGAANGSATVAGDGSFTYAPAPGFASGDSFAFRLSDSAGNSNLYLAFIEVRPSVALQLGGSTEDVMRGTSGNDTIDAAAGHDIIRGSYGNDDITGGAGIDTLVYSGLRADFAISGANNILKPGLDGNDTVHTVERLRFDDTCVALDINGAAGQTYRVYQAAFDRKPDAAGFGYWLYNMDRGVSIDAVAAAFMTSGEFITLYGAAPTAQEFVSRLYSNVLHRAPEQGGYDFWVNAVANGFSRSAVLAMFAESAENQAQVIGIIEQGMDYTPFVPG